MKIFVEKEWISGDTCVFTIHNQFDRLQVKSGLRKIREALVERLKNQGYEVITDYEDVDDETVCLIMDQASLLDVDKSLDEYMKAIKEKICTSAGDNFHYPLSKNLEDYFNDPFLPAVFKNEFQNGGKDKFLILTPEQIGIIKHFYETHKDEEKMKEAFSNCIIQQFISTPTKYATYMRVLVNGAGEVMGANLKCARKEIEKSKLESPFEKVFMDPNSKYYLDTTKMFNYYSGGLEIAIPQPKYSTEKADILKEHGFDMENVAVPDEVLDVIKNIMYNCHKEIGVMCGIDFMLNADDGHWYYLEYQAFPAIDEWAKPKGITISSTHTLKGYIKYNEVELQAREEALMATIKYYEEKMKISNPKLTVKLPKENN